jgi:gluconokinase
VNGSFASLPFIAQMISDIFNKPVSVKDNSDSIALGAFLVTNTQMGIYKNLEEAAQTITLPAPYRPKKADHEVYMKYFSIFERLSTRFADEFEEIANLQQ